MWCGSPSHPPSHRRHRLPDALLLFCMKSFDDISLSAKSRKFVASRIASGRYQSPKDVLDNALSLLESVEREHEARLAAINAGIDRGLADLDAGRYSIFDKEAAQRIKRMGRERLAQRKGKSA